MAKNYTEEEVEEAEKQAGLKERMAAAEEKLNRRPLTARELESREAARREAWHQSNMDARNRRLDAMEQIAIRDRGRYSPMTRQQIDLMRDKESNRRFDVENKTRLQESADKREGMIHQGEGAAKEKAKGAVDAATVAAEAEKHKADQQRAAAEYLGRIEHGYTDADGVYHPGSAERLQESKNKGELEKTRQQGADNLAITKQQGADNLAAEQERSKSAQTQAQIKALTEAAKSDEKIELLRIKSKSKLNEIQFKGLVTQISKELMGDPMTGRKAMTPDELRKKYKDNPDALNILNGGVSAGGGGGTSDFEVK